VGAAAAAAAAAAGSDGESDSSDENVNVCERFRSVKKVKLNVPEAAPGPASGRKSPSSARSNASARPPSRRLGPMPKSTPPQVPRKGPGVGKHGAKRQPAAAKKRV
jgi:hypothetical protein